MAKRPAIAQEHQPTTAAERIEAEARIVQADLSSAQRALAEALAKQRATPADNALDAEIEGLEAEIEEHEKSLKRIARRREAAKAVDSQQAKREQIAALKSDIKSAARAMAALHDATRQAGQIASDLAQKRREVRHHAEAARKTAFAVLRAAYGFEVAQRHAGVLSVASPIQADYVVARALHEQYPGAFNFPGDAARPLDEQLQRDMHTVVGALERAVEQHEVEVEEKS